MCDLKIEIYLKKKTEISDLRKSEAATTKYNVNQNKQDLCIYISVEIILFPSSLILSTSKIEAVLLSAFWVIIYLYKN